MSSYFVFIYSVLALASLIDCNKERIVSGFIGGSVPLKCPVSLTRGDELMWKDSVYNLDRVPILAYSSKSGVNWRHPNQEQISVENNVLIISGLRDYDAGDYYCIVKRKNKSEERFHYVMDLYTKPVCRGRTQVKDGGKATLKCSTDVSMGGTPNMEWTDQNGNITSKDKSDIFQVKKEFSFKVTPVNDGENYTCIVSAKTFGGIANESCTMTIEVLFAPKNVEIIPDKAVYNIGDVITFSATGNPAPDLNLSPPGTKAKDGTLKVKVTKSMADRNFTYVFTAKNKLSPTPLTMTKSFFVQGITTTVKTTPPPRKIYTTIRSQIAGANMANFQSSASVQLELPLTVVIVTTGYLLWNILN